jgi:hypothetical protein
MRHASWRREWTARASMRMSAALFAVGAISVVSDPSRCWSSIASGCSCHSSQLSKPICCISATAAALAPKVARESTCSGNESGGGATAYRVLA